MTDSAGGGAPAATFASHDPATGETVGSFPVYDAAAVGAAVERARDAAAWWAGIGYSGRGERLRAYAAVLARRMRELAELIHRENGKPVDDALLELVLTIDHLRWAAGHAERVLRRRQVPPGLLMPNVAASVDYVPYGVVAVIGPWNYPVFTPMGSIGYALAAGNAVVFKPSEHTPLVGRWLAEAFAEVVPERPVFQVVTGLGETGAALSAAQVDKLAFTGSTGTAKVVMATAAQSLTPVVIECGGKDPLIVAADADLDAAVDGALWGGFTNGGQTCVGVERVYAVDPVYDDFIARLTSRALALRPGDDRWASYGPITVPDQIDVIRRHIDDALARGARAVVGGPESVRPPYVDPVVLVDVPADAAAEQEETFGPVLTVSRVGSVDAAVTRANGTGYGLGATVYSRERGEELAHRLRTGMVSVNSVVTFAAVPALPFGGVGRSGFGRIHGADGLREFSRVRSVARARFPSPLAVMTFRRSERAVSRLVNTVQRIYGR